MKENNSSPILTSECMLQVVNTQVNENKTVTDQHLTHCLCKTCTCIIKTVTPDDQPSKGIQLSCTLHGKLKSVDINALFRAKEAMTLWVSTPLILLAYTLILISGLCCGWPGCAVLFSPNNVVYIHELNGKQLQTKAKNAQGIHHGVGEYLQIDWKKTLFFQSKN